MHFNTPVSGVSGDAKSKYSLFGGGGGDILGTFDAVIIAVPISLAGIALDVRAEVTVTPNPMWSSVFAANRSQTSAVAWESEHDMYITRSISVSEPLLRG